MTAHREDGAEDTGDGWMSRQQARALVFTVLVAVLAYLCWLIVEPLVAPIAWALALAVVTRPLHAWLLRRVKYKSLAAVLATLLVVVTLVVPSALAGRQVLLEAAGAATKVQAMVKNGSWHAFVERTPRVAAALAWIDATVDVPAQLGKLSEHVPKAVQQIMAGSLQIAVGVGVTLFLLFFFLRDRVQMLDALRGLLPLSAHESALMFRQVDDTVYAILYGTLAVSLVQGALGALAFWWLNLPAPLLWGSAMAVLSVVPLVGTALVWGPAAVYLLLEGSAANALLLAAWGFLVIGLVDNLLKPAIVRNRLHAHIVPVFVSILGGLAAFGAAGVIIGPVLLSVALALLDISRQRRQ